MTCKKNLCQKCGVRHSAPTGKKCAKPDEGNELMSESQVGTVSNGLQASPPVKPKKPVNTDHLARAVEDRVEKVEESV